MHLHHVGVLVTWSCKDLWRPEVKEREERDRGREEK